MLFFSREVKYALGKEPNFHIFGASISLSGSIGESEEERNRKINEMLKTKDDSQKIETVQIITMFFGRRWEVLKCSINDLSSDERTNWDSSTEEQKKIIITAVRKKKLEKIKAEIEHRGSHARQLFASRLPHDFIHLFRNYLP